MGGSLLQSRLYHVSVVCHGEGSDRLSARWQSPQTALSTNSCLLVVVGGGPWPFWVALSEVAGPSGLHTRRVSAEERQITSPAHPYEASLQSEIHGRLSSVYNVRGKEESHLHALEWRCVNSPPIVRMFVNPGTDATTPGELDHLGGQSCFEPDGGLWCQCCSKSGHAKQ